MADRPSYRGLSPGRWLLVATIGFVVVVVLEGLFPGLDLSRGSPDRWWLLGGVFLVGLVVLGGRRLARGRGRGGR